MVSMFFHTLKGVLPFLTDNLRPPVNGHRRAVRDEGGDRGPQLARQLDAAEGSGIVDDRSVARLPQSPGRVVNIVLERVLARLTVVAPEAVRHELLERPASGDRALALAPSRDHTFPVVEVPLVRDARRRPGLHRAPQLDDEVWLSVEESRHPTDQGTRHELTNEHDTGADLVTDDAPRVETQADLSEIRRERK